MNRSLRLSLLNKLRSRVSPKRGEAFSYTELLIGSVVSVIIIGAFGALTLISELRVGRDAEVNQSLRDTWSRTLAFISNETRQANWIRTTLGNDDYPCAGLAAPGGPLLVLDGPPNPATPADPMWRVVYGVRSNNDNNVATEWRGANRLVRCGPPFERIARENATQGLDAALRSAAIGGNLSFSEPSTETVIADQLTPTRAVPCNTADGVPVDSPCMQPFQARLFDPDADRDRDAQLSLFMGRRAGGLTYPPASFTGFHTQIRANRNPGFDITGNPDCATVTDSLSNQEPRVAASCVVSLRDPSSRSYVFKEYILPQSGNLTVNGCGTGCVGPTSTESVDVIFLNGLHDDFVKQFSATDAQRPCSRRSCYLSRAGQTVQIYDGNILVFYDRILRL